MQKIKTPAITKNEFLEIFELLKKQEEKDYKFCDFMEEYLDGRFVPVMNENANLAVMKMLSYCFNDRVKDEHDSTFVEWWMYDCGEITEANPACATLDDVEYKMHTLEQFYDFLVVWMNSTRD